LSKKPEANDPPKKVLMRGGVPDTKGGRPLFRGPSKKGKKEDRSKGGEGFKKKVLLTGEKKEKSQKRGAPTIRSPPRETTKESPSV